MIWTQIYRYRIHNYQHFTIRYISDNIGTSSPSHLKYIIAGMRGNCLCTHVIDGCYSQLHPCQFFCEIFLYGEKDPDYMYILCGVTFGFHIINQKCSTMHHSRQKKISSDEFKNIIEKKLVNEILEEKNVYSD